MQARCPAAAGAPHLPSSAGAWHCTEWHAVRRPWSQQLACWGRRHANTLAPAALPHTNSLAAAAMALLAAAAEQEDVPLLSRLPAPSELGAVLPPAPTPSDCPPAFLKGVAIRHVLAAVQGSSWAARAQEGPAPWGPRSALRRAHAPTPAAAARMHAQLRMLSAAVRCTRTHAPALLRARAPMPARGPPRPWPLLALRMRS